jgi:hypothetical protein
MAVVMVISLAAAVAASFSRQNCGRGVGDIPA